MSEKTRRRKLLRLLSMSYHGEIGSAALYGRQAKSTRDKDLSDRLSEFLEDESRHAATLALMAWECGGRKLSPMAVGKSLFSFFGLLTAWLGVRSILAVNMYLERTGIDLYKKMSPLLPRGPERDRYECAVKEMIADEQRHQAWFRQKSATRHSLIKSTQSVGQDARGRQ